VDKLDRCAILLFGYRSKTGYVKRQ